MDIPDHEYRKLAKLLREIRLSTGLTQQEVAARLDVPQSFVSKYEAAERRLDVFELHEVANALNTTLDDVLPRIISPRAGSD